MKFLMIGLLILSSCSSYNQNTMRAPSSEEKLSEFELGISKTEISKDSCIKYEYPTHIEPGSSERIQCGSFLYDSISIVKNFKINKSSLAFGTGVSDYTPFFHGDPNNISFGPEVNWVYIYDYRKRRNHYIGAYYHVQIKENSAVKDYLVVIGFQDKRGGYQLKLLSVLEDEIQASKAHQLLISFYEGETIDYDRCDSVVSVYRGCDNE